MADADGLLAGLESDQLVDQSAGYECGHADGRSAGQRAGLVALEHADDAGADVHLRGIDGLAADVGEADRSRHEADFRDSRAVGGGVGRVFGEAHLDAGSAADGFQLCGQSLVGVHLSGQLGAGDAEVGSADQDHGIGDVEDGSLDGAKLAQIQHFLGAAGGEELAGLGTCRVEEVDLQLTGSAVHACDGAGAFVVELAVLDGDFHVDGLVGVQVEHMHHSGGLGQILHEAHLHGVGSGGGGHVAAVALVVDLGLAHDGLAHDVIDVDAGAVTLADHDDLVVAGHAAAHAVDLLGVGAAHGLHKDVVPLVAGGQVALKEHAALRRAAAHEYTRKFTHISSSFRSEVFESPVVLAPSNHKTKPL